jgi:hypothetical protein
MLVYELTADERARAIADITAMLAQDKLVHNVAATLPLNDIVAAHQMVEQGKAIGNVVMEVGWDGLTPAKPVPAQAGSGRKPISGPNPSMGIAARCAAQPILRRRKDQRFDHHRNGAGARQ